MYNRQTFEYREVEADEYEQYEENATSLLSEISEWYEKPISEISYTDIIYFFINKFNIEIVYFDNKSEIFVPNYRFINKEIYGVHSTFTEKVSGFTVTNGEKYKIFLRKYRKKQRIKFTLLHELVHIYFHCIKSDYLKLFYSINVDSHYPKEIIPFENEANVIASILYLNDEKLVDYFYNDYSFDRIMVIHNISRSALHNRIKNFLIYTIGLNPSIAFYQYLLPYREEVYGTCAVKKMKLLLRIPKKIFT
ncbi:ImmA/IrrE family metallo-endopeptidase [Enterococcus sp. DIV1420a]|uniref:ImmA/IrrE family metallo-endopeptidase n=1 Tax=Enterococcus sp. DIV1420a TaxID=2774672 RepID=UPI003F20783C